MLVNQWAHVSLVLAELMAMVKAGAAMEVVETVVKNISTEPVREW